MAAPQNMKLAKDCRAYIGTTSTATADEDFLKIVNENELAVNWSTDTQELDTKEDGKISVSGTESYEFTFTANRAFLDETYALLVKAKNKSWPYQIRDSANKMYTGNFILTGRETSAGAVGVQSIAYTLKNSGKITEYDEAGVAIVEDGE